MTGRQRGMTRSRKMWLGLLGLGLWLGTGCADSTDAGNGNRPASETDLRSSKTSLLRADSCGDLLTKIQDDAIAKLDLAVSQAKDSYQNRDKGDWPGQSETDDGDFGGVAPPRGQAPTPSTPTTGAGSAGPGGGAVGGVAGGTAGGLLGGGGSGPTDPGESGGNGAPPPDSAGSGDGKEPIGSSDTNTQVEGVDEADFIKLVDSGKGMFLLHGNTLLKLKTYPAEALSLEPPQLKIEGAPSELFVTDAGRAVIFSSVGGYQFGGDLLGGTPGSNPVGDVCTPEFCGGKGGYGGNAIKITLADVSGSEIKVLRELYYEGGYVSSRRIDNVVRVVLQGQSSYYGLFHPEVDLTDPWGRPYPESEVNAQLDQWRERVASSIRDTKLNDWVPVAKEAKGGKLVDVDPQCDSFYVPRPGLSDSGIVHVLSLDVSKDDAAVGGITVMGQASTVYSSLDRLVLAQPDYRWLGNGLGDVGFLDEQRTSLHVFELSKADTKYLASGFVAGHLPSFNPQFGLDVTEDHALRIASTGRVRANPEASRNSPEFWNTDTRNVVSVLREEGDGLKLVGTSEKLGLPGESIFSARFVGPRAYVVTFRQTDPLYALDVSGDQPKLLGELKIPGFSQYMHPLDDDHLITFGQTGTGGSQLQLFDVSDPANLPLPKTLDFGGGSGSEVANQHKAFTFYGPQSLIALPVSGSRLQNNAYSYMAALRVIRVNKDTGFELVGSIDHSGFYTSTQNNGCFSCGPWGCNNFCPDYGGSNVRRGHFVEDEDSTFVYAIGSAGVTVSDLGDLASNIAEVRLPAVNFSSSPWYTDGGTTGGTGSRPSGGSVGGGSTGTGGVGVGVSTPPVTEPSPPKPSMTDVPPEPAADAGVATPAP